MLGVKDVRYLCGVDSTLAHTHQYQHQMIFIRLGEVALHIEGRSYTACAPCVIFISRLEQHSLRIVSEEYERYTVNLDPDAFAVGGELQLTAVFTDRPASFCHVLSLTPEVSARLDGLLSLAVEEWRRKDPAFPDATEELFRLSLLLLLRYAPGFFPADKEGNVAVIQNVRHTIENHLTEDLSLSELGQQYHLNPYYLAHRFKAVTGYSIKNYQLRCRVTAARLLLETTDLRITEICEHVGFSDVSSLSRYFRREVGETPTQYRRKIRQGLPV